MRRSLLAVPALLSLVAAPAAALAPGEVVVATSDELLVVDPQTGDMQALAPDEDPSELRWGTAVVGEGGVVFLLQTSEDMGRVVELFPDERSSRVVVEHPALAQADAIAVVAAGSGAIARFRVSCGIGFELVLLLPGLMWLHRRRQQIAQL